MSSVPLVFLVAEGEADVYVLDSAMRQVFTEGYELSVIRPVGFRWGEPGRAEPFGWSRVLKWLQDSQTDLPRGPSPVLGGAVTVVHLDADVADVRGVGSLPDCPPAEAGAHEVRTIALDRAGLPSLPPDVVVCIPSKGTDTWVLAGAFGAEAQAIPELECSKATKTRWWRAWKASHAAPKQLPYRPAAEHYADVARSLDWPSVLDLCPQARRFQDDLLAAVGALRAGA